MDAQEKQMLKLCKLNKREGFELLFKKYEKFIYSVSFRYTNSKEDALDIMQEVFLKIYRNFDKYDVDKPILTWIKKITVNTCLNHLRDQKKDLVSIDTHVGEENVTLGDTLKDKANTEQQVVYADTKKVLEQSIAELSDDIKMAIILRHVKGMSYQDIADIMSCPIGTIKTYIFKGRKLLKDKLILKGVWEV